jgi:hypothetical protein
MTSESMYDFPRRALESEARQEVSQAQEFTPAPESTTIPEVDTAHFISQLHTIGSNIIRFRLEVLSDEEAA